VTPVFPEQPDDRLPIDDVMGDILDASESDRGSVIKAPPGAGKTTRVPPALIEGGVVDGEVWVLEPRRLAASMTARRVAEERGVSIGNEVGYQVRFDHRRSDDTLVNYVTEGIFLRRAQQDPLLEGIGAVVLDEFHERSIDADLSIAFLKEIADVRPELVVTVMSATIDTGPIGDYLDVPTIESEGRVYPVDKDYLSDPPDDREDAVVESVRQLLRTEPDNENGDILIFMPGAGSIHRVVDELEPMLNSEFDVRPLYGGLSPDKQDAALADSDKRRVIVSTNIAETSLTIHGVTAVIDSGLVKRVYYDAGSGVDRLETEQISMASAKQRAGRAGRVEPGRAIRAWPKSRDFRMPDREIPAVKRVDLARAILEAIAWTGGDPSEFDWFERPEQTRIDESLQLLRQLGLVSREGFSLTEFGEQARDVPAHPRIARIVIEGRQQGVETLACGAGAILSERDFVMSEDDRVRRSDIWWRLELLEGLFGRLPRPDTRKLNIHFGRAKRVRQVWNQLSRSGLGGIELRDEAYEPVTKSIIAGFPDRVCLRRGEDRNYVSVQGEPMTLAFESSLENPDLIVAPRAKGSITDYDNQSVGQRQLIRLAAEIERDWLAEATPGLMQSDIQLTFSSKLEAVCGRNIEKMGTIELTSSPVSVKQHFSERQITDKLIENVEGQLDLAFDLSDRDRQLLYRLNFLAETYPEQNLPDFLSGDFGEEERQILEQICWGQTEFKALRRMNFSEKLGKCLPYEVRELLESKAPTSFRVPAGVQRQLDYSGENPPTMRARIQELFGLEKTPTVADGWVSVTLELLAPNFRSVQRTDDLENFWANTYPDIRKDYRGQYPKHPWPESPLDAQAVSI
jgi:ATP-dependent helicase HrpB